MKLPISSDDLNKSKSEKSPADKITIEHVARKYQSGKKLKTDVYKSIHKEKPPTKKNTNDIITIRNILTEEQMQLKNDNVLFEGELGKYQHKAVTRYITRWCQITNSQFMYFSSHISAISLTYKPLMIIPLKYIKEVKKVQSASSKNENKDRYQFEIFIKNYTTSNLELPTFNKIDKFDFKDGSNSTSSKMNEKHFVKLDKHKWMDRKNQLNWSKERLIFTTSNEIYFLKWMCVFEWILSKSI